MYTCHLLPTHILTGNRLACKGPLEGVLVTSCRVRANVRHAVRRLFAEQQLASADDAETCELRAVCSPCALADPAPGEKNISVRRTARPHRNRIRFIDVPALSASSLIGLLHGTLQHLPISSCAPTLRLPSTKSSRSHILSSLCTSRRLRPRLPTTVTIISSHTA